MNDKRQFLMQLEVTDTFGGESNWSWVKKGTTRASSRRGIVRAIKTLAGWHGWVRVRVEDLGDVVIVRPCANSGVCQIGYAYVPDEE
jgi:hypothetical protein